MIIAPAVTTPTADARPLPPSKSPLVGEKAFVKAESRLTSSLAGLDLGDTARMGSMAGAASAMFAVGLTILRANLPESVELAEAVRQAMDGSHQLAVDVNLGREVPADDVLRRQIDGWLAVARDGAAALGALPAPAPPT